MNRPQLTDTIIMVRPCNFRYNIQTASDNVYQKKILNFSDTDVQEKAQVEFDNFVNILRGNLINVIVFEDTLTPHTPDSVFPNNWISTHHNGNIVLYPMFASNRRLERRMDIVNFLKEEFEVKNTIDDMLKFEKNGQYLEGTGSMVLDREHGIVYACLSKRSDLSLLNYWCEKMSFELIFFRAKDGNKDIYHTNVLMSICKDLVFICLDTISDEEEKEQLLTSFQTTNKKVIDISITQMNSFLGNVLELKNSQGESFLIMSTSAFNSLSSEQNLIINQYVKILHSSLNVIEHFGGGSARCMIAEVFLNRIK